VPVNDQALKRVMEIYGDDRAVVERRLDEFSRVWKQGSEEDLFSEMAFCLLTPQSKARVCWAAITALRENGLLFRGTPEQIVEHLRGVRFKVRKSQYIVLAREQFSEDGSLAVRKRIAGLGEPYQAREWLVRNVKGYGYKEAGHFLRNIGLGSGLTILDRHILKNLKLLGVIEEVPASLSVRKYLEIEEKMKLFAEDVGIPVEELDLVLWYKEAGEVFK
jgi:N-glycosylase/DNA lyase